VICEKQRPPADDRAGVGKDSCTGSIADDNRRWQLPYCERFGVRWDRQPPTSECPFLDPESVYKGATCSVLRMQDVAYDKMIDLKRPDADPAGGLLLLKAAETCYVCIDADIRHPVIQALRARAKEQIKPETMPRRVPIGVGGVGSNGTPPACSEPKKIISRRVARPGAVLCR